MKSIIMIFMAIGATVGGFVPLIWGGSLLSISSILFSGVGGFVGIWVGYRLATRYL